MNTPYDVLQVSRNADPETIKAAYKSLVQRHHPDKNPNTPNAENQLKDINRAYEVLSDPVKRAAYDAGLAKDEENQTASHKNWSGFSSGVAPAENDANPEKATPFDRAHSLLWNFGFWFGRGKKTVSSNGSTSPAKKRDYLVILDIFLGVAAGDFCSKFISTIPPASPVASGLAVGISFALGCGIGYSLSRSLRSQLAEKIKKQSAVIFGSLFISLGLSLALLTATALLTQTTQNFDVASAEPALYSGQFDPSAPVYRSGDVVPADQVITSQGYGMTPVPALTAHVIDATGTLSSAETQALENKLNAFEQTRGSRVVLLLVPTTQPEDITSYANRVANTWKIGRKEIDDGLLVVVAKNDRKVRIEVAKTLEGVIPDLAAKRIIDEAITPRFKQGDFAGGLEAAVGQIMARING